MNRFKLGEYLKHKSLLRFFILLTVFSFVIFFLITGLTIGLNLRGSFNKINDSYKRDQLNSIKVNLNQYLNSHVKVLSDIASFPLVTSSVMANNLSKNLVDYLSATKVLGDKGKKSILLVNKKLLYEGDHEPKLELNAFSKLDAVLEGKAKADIIFSSAGNLIYAVPIMYQGVPEGVMFYEQKFRFVNVLGKFKNIAIELVTANDIKNTFGDFEAFSQEEEIYSTELKAYDLKISMLPRSDQQNDILKNLALSLFLSLLLGTLLSTVIVFIYGRNYLLEPYQNLERVKSQLDLALQASNVGTWYWDMKSGVVTWDEHIYKVYGAEKTDFENNYESFEKFVIPDDREPLRKVLEECLEKQSYLDSEFRIRRADNNELRYIGVKARFITNDRAEPIAMTGVNFDISNLRELTKKLEESEARIKNAYHELDMILDAVPSFIFYKDDKNNIIRANKHAADSLSIDKEELAGKATKDYYPDLHEKYYADDMEVVSSGKSKLGIVEEYVPEGGDKLWIKTDKIPLRRLNSSEVDSLLVVATDITEQKVNQDLIVQKTQELEKSNKSLEQFAYFVSHDLQEPIRTVSNYVELLQRQLKKKGLSDENIDKFSSYIAKSTRRMRDMIQDILEFARIGSAGDYEDIDINLLINDIRQTLQQQIEATRAEIVYGDLPTINARKFEMNQLFQNLLSNAIKYTPKEREPRVEIFCREQKAFYEFIVKDNACGIAEEDFDRVFQIFQRVEHDIDGSGVGLPICKKVVENYGGEMQLKSVLGQGTEFIFTIRK